MLFLVTLEHDPENCWARPENAETAVEWIDAIGEKSKKTGVDVLGAYVTPNEHTFYFVLRAQTFEAVSRFLGPPLLHDHDADVAPVMKLDELEDVIVED